MGEYSERIFNGGREEGLREGRREGRLEGHREGRLEGHREGQLEGRREERQAMIRIMKTQGVDEKTIEKILENLREEETVSV